ncbi:hypothetical protein KCP73_08940 [Salmonella enterica subsp. enterica]|nr:hypothetical protein KCP73_08940 [Salmonella enterica subsp. enterica]
MRFWLCSWFPIAAALQPEKWKGCLFSAGLFELLLSGWFVTSIVSWLTQAHYRCSVCDGWRNGRSVIQTWL